MKTSEFIAGFFDSIENGIRSIDRKKLEQSASIIFEKRESGKKIIIVGNGGSAAMASHVAVDFTKAAGIRAINFNEADLITCFANDYGYEHWVSKALEAYADEGDIVFLISSSGKSQNIVNAALTAREMGVYVITVSGFSSSNPLRALGDIDLWVDSYEYNIVEMTHHIWLLAIVELLILEKQI